ncbi:hypothetical protein N7488_010395 [Penicillium malachiteum]|nr:hypothetical protein N7488_010395 [Penicillium malachiteum]
MSLEVAVALVRPPFEAGANPSASMAALMQSTNDPVAVSNPITGSSPSISTSDPISFLKPPSKPESNLSSIASAGLHVSRSQPPQMTSPSSAPDRPVEQDRDAERNSSQVAREALGASEKSPAPSIQEPQIHASPEQMQIDTHSNDTSDPYGPGDHSNSLMHASTVASPGPIEELTSQDGDRHHHRPRDDSEIDQDSNKAFSYPMPTGSLNDPRRGLSLPHTGYSRGSPRSPSAKKHRCPYCATEFTRQHNLKSHLLTHSQEKPFVCSTCQSRFRRLHDLKRHTKLHTGERPHTCPKCGRRFARGDALARHNKGQGGCAGRRASMGSFAPDDEYGDGQHPDDGMDGLVYAEPESMDGEEERRLNSQGLRKMDDSISRSDSLNNRQPSTYPPIAANRGSIFTPSVTHGGSGSTSSTSQAGNLTFPPAGHPSGTSLFTPSTLAETSKPLSPNALSHHDSSTSSHRGHSPSLGQSLPHPQVAFGRGGITGPNHPLGLTLPQPGTKLPPPVINSPDPRFGPTPNKHTSSHSHSSSHGLPPPPGIDGPGPEGPGDAGQIDKLWAYVRSLNDELTGLRNEVVSLRAHIASISNSSTVAPADSNQPGHISR